MKNRDSEKYSEYLTLFGLKDNYDLYELSASYRTLAKLNHPDLIKDRSSGERMSLINEAYAFLKDILASGEAGLQQNEDRKIKREDPFYNQYKKGFDILKNAFEDYFGEGPVKKNFRDEAVLREQLKLAKSEFSKVVNDLPYNEWVNDAIDKISSINKWLA